jgi:RimJ/RimL family protein N-acetyltransferase
MIGKTEVKLDFLSHNEALLLNEYRNLPEIRDWCRQHSLIDEEQQLKWYHWQSSDPNTQMFGINVKLPEKANAHFLAGVCGLTSIDWVHRRAEFSCYVFPKYQRRGYCETALIELFDHAFNNLNLNLVWGETFENNPALTLFTDILGMQKDGVRRQFYYKNGSYIDAYMLSITAQEWREMGISHVL